jgi:hypothetical protein
MSKDKSEVRKEADTLVDQLNQILDPKGWAAKSNVSRIEIMARPHPRMAEEGLYPEATAKQAKRWNLLTNEGIAPRKHSRTLLGNT